MWNYVTSNVVYYEDNEVCYLKEITDHGFKIGYINNYIQTPNQTFELGRGDSEDQAILFFTLIKAYWRNVYGTIYDLYLTEVEFYDGSIHYAVFLPVVDGFVCIFDPTEGYLTTSELPYYNSLWEERHDIKSLKLYSINDYSGTHSIAFEGTLEDTISFLSQG